MSKKQKLIMKIKNNPKAIRFEEVDRLLIEIGCDRRQPRSGSSHFIYFIDDWIFTIPYKRPYVKEVYIREIIKYIDANQEGKE